MSLFNRLNRVFVSHLMVLCLCLAGRVHAANGRAETFHYVVNLASSKQPISSEAYRQASLNSGLRVYAVRLDVPGSYKYRVRLGFFQSQQEATAFLAKLKRRYTGAWLDKIRRQDRVILNQWLADASQQTGPQAYYGSLTREKLKNLMAQAHEAMLAKHYTRAIRIYTRVLQSGANVSQQEAQEYLGLARERKGQLAHAIAEYRIYLRRFPDSEGAERVRQRLDALLTARRAPTPDLPTFVALREANDWQNYGTLMQYYDRDVINTNRFGAFTASSIFASYFNHGARSEQRGYKMKTDFSATHIYDVQQSETDDQQLNSMYFDMVTPGNQLATRMGRQKGRSGGVVGRFDGVDLGYRLSSRQRLRFISGIPFEHNETVESRTDKYFYSLGWELGPFNDSWDFSVFALQQVANDLVDRQEVGMEMRYRTPHESLFTLLDYSTQFSTINYFMGVYNRRFQDQSAFDVTLNYRRSPFLTSTNALQGQVGASTLDDLLADLSEFEIEQISLERTALYKSMSLAYRRPLQDWLEFNTDISVSNLSGTDASAGVDATEGTGNEYSLATGLIASNFLVKDDINLVNVRVSDLFSSDVMVLSLSSKYRFGRKWRLNPRLRYEDRDYNDGRQINKLVPSLRLQYRQSRSWEFELQYTYEDKTTSEPGLPDQDETSYILYGAYVYSFQ